MPYRPSSTDLLVALTLSVALTAIALASMRLVERDRAALYALNGDDRQDSLGLASSRVAESLQDVIDDLHFGAQLVTSDDDAVRRREVLSALIGTVRAYQAMVLTDGDGALLDVIGDPREGGARARAIAPLVQQAARNALGAGAADVTTSRALDGDEGVRVFATRLADGGGGGALALVVDIEPILAPLGILAAEQATWVVAVGPFGRVMSIHSPGAERLPEVVASGAAPGLAAVLADVRAGGSGTRRIPANEVQALGLGPDEALAAWRPITTGGIEPWGAVSLSSMSALRAHERSLLWRVGGAGLGAGLLVMAFGAYGFLAVRRTRVLAERLQHADALAALRQRAALIVAHIPSAVLVVGADGAIADVNPAFTRRFGAPRPGSDLRASLPLAAPDAVTHLEALVADAQANGKPVVAPETALQLDAAPGRYGLHAVPLQEGDEAAGVLLVIDDLSEVAGLRTRLVRTEKLATVGVLAAGIAHEIGTPLGVIRGRAEYTAGKLGAGHNQAAALAIIIEQIDRVTRIIRGLLDFSHERPGVRGTHDAAGIVARVAALMRVEAQQRGVRLDVAPIEPGPLVSADPDQLEQVLVNLVINALDATERGGSVVVRVADQQGGGARIVVQDDGCGIPAEDLHRIFDPFFTTKKRGQGTGLGLSVVLQLVRAHGATLEFDSAPGRGTRAILQWPGP